MMEENTLLVEMTDRLLRDLASKTSASSDVLEHWPLIESQSLPNLLVSTDQGGFEGTWSDAQAVFFATGYHGVSIPLSETILAKHLLSQTGATPRSGAHTIGLCEPNGRLIAAPACAPHAFGGRLKAPPGATLCSTLVTCAENADGHWIVAIDTEHARSDPGEAFPAYLTFQDAPIRHAALLPTHLPSFKHLCAAMRTAQIAGAMLAVLNMTQQHVADRRQFGRSLSHFQVIQHQLAIMAEETVAVSYAASFAFAALQNTRADFEIAAAKLRASRAIPTIVSTAHQLHGAIGFTPAYQLHRFTARLRNWRSEFGGDAHWAKVLGETVLTESRGNFWAFLTRRFDAGLGGGDASGHFRKRELDEHAPS